MWMRKMIKLNHAKLILLFILQQITFVHSDSWDSNPNNWNNSPNNWENSPNNWNNSHNNWENSPNNLNSDRIIRNEEGEPTGYSVPKSDGGTNYFDLDGNRTGYKY